MSKVHAVLVTAAILVGSAGVGGCNRDGRTESSASATSVWNNLGGERNVRKVVDDFVARGAADPQVNFFRKGAPGVKEWKPTEQDVVNLKQRLVELISSGTGGPMKYTGRDMKSSHKGMKITTAEFNALAGHLDAALRAGGARDADRAAVMAFAGTTARDIIEVQ